MILMSQNSAHRFVVFCRLWSILLGVLLLMAGCGERAGGQGAGERQYPYRVVTTVGMVGDIVRNVAGEKANVQTLIGEGVDPHLYRPTPGDINALLKSQVIFYSGLMLEGKMADTLVSLSRHGKPVHAVTELLDPQYLLEPPQLQGHYDPHVWMDVAAWSLAVKQVANALAEFDPDNAEYYQANATGYRAELARLDEYARNSLASIPKNSRVLITAHDAFNYFGRAYGLDVLGIQGISTADEASVSDINRLVDAIISRDVKAVFVESSVPEKNVRALIEGVAARGRSITVGGELYSDAMGPAGTYEGTYIGMLDHNITAIARALGGSAPAAGMQGNLTEQP